MVTPAQRREAIAHLEAAHEMSERRACRVTGADRKSMRYRSQRGDDAEVIGRHLAAVLVDPNVSVIRRRDRRRIAASASGQGGEGGNPCETPHICSCIHCWPHRVPRPPKGDRLGRVRVVPSDESDGPAPA